MASLLRLSGPLVGVLLLLSGCGNTSSDGPSDDDAGLGGAKSEDKPRVPPRVVTIGLPRVVSRTVTPGEDGIYTFGEPVALDDVRTCIIERRDAYAVFEEYERLDDPICVTTSEGENPELSGVPAYSDLTITVEKDGYLPALITHRVEGQDVFKEDFLTVLFESSQEQLFEQPLSDGEPARKDERAFITVEYVVYSGVSSPEEVDLTLGRTSLDFQVARGAHSEFFRTSGAPLGSVVYDRTPELLQLPANMYRVVASYPNAVCEALGALPLHPLWGLPTAESEQIEVRTSPGHVTSFVGICVCAPPPTETALLVDAATCTYE